MGDSESEEEVEVYIERGDQRESFSPEKANNAKAVKKRFSLKEEPASVFSLRTGKAVAFGKLKPGVIYKLEAGDNFSRQNYEGQPDIYIEKGEKRHTFPPAKANEPRTVQRTFSLDTDLPVSTW